MYHFGLVHAHLSAKNVIIGHDVSDADLAVICCGHMKRCPPEKHPHTVRWPNSENSVDSYSLEYIHRGSGTFVFGDKTHRLSAGTAVLYRPGEPRHYIYDPIDEPESYWVRFGGKYAGEIIKHFKIQGKIFYFQNTKNFIKIVQTMITEAQTGAPQAPLICTGLLITLLGEASKIILNNEESKITPIHQSTQLILQNLRITNAELAEYCGLSLSHFEHLFKKIHGCSPMQYRLNAQIEKAKIFLQETPLPINEIALTVGYDNPLYFSRIFKKKTGLPPMAYRNQMKNQNN